VLVRSERKAHFEPVAAHLGFVLVLGAIFSGIGEDGAAGTAYRLGLLAVGAGLATGAFRSGRFPLFGMGLVAAYVGLSAVVLTAVNEAFLVFLWFTATGIGMLVCLLVAQKAMRGRE
jgi:hypothetical protein